MKQLHPIPTGDGQIVDLKDIEVFPVADSSALKDVFIGRAAATVGWDGPDLGLDAREFLDTHGVNADRSNYDIITHIRSFLARSGLDGSVNNVEYSNGTLYAEMDLEFLVDRSTSKGVTFPLYEGIRKNLLVQSIKVANLIFVPKEAQALNETELRDALADHSIDLPRGWSMSNGGSLIEIPLSDGQYNVGGIRALAPDKWGSFFNGSKRVLMSHQERRSPPDNFLRAPFDVREISLFASDDYRLVLHRETNNAAVIHSNSPFLKLNDPLPRHVELRTVNPTVEASSVKVRGRIFQVQFDSSVSLRVNRSEKEPPKSTTGTFSIDRALTKNSSVVSEFVRIVSNCRQAGLLGVLVGADGVGFLPDDPDVLMRDWALQYAIRGEIIDLRAVDRIPQDTRRTLVEHEGAKILAKACREGSTHNLTHHLVTSALPLPEDMRILAQQGGAGVGSFFATDLQQLTAEKMNGGFAHLSLDHGAISQYSQLVRAGIASVYWQPPSGEMRKLIGPTFVNLSLENFYRNLDFIVSVYCSHMDSEAFNSEFDRQAQQFVKLLDGLQMNVAIASGASTGLMKRLAEVASGFTNVQPMGFSTLFHNQQPDLTPGILTICAHGDLRYRQMLLTKAGDIRVALNGGAGTTGEIAQDIVDEKFGFTMPGPLGVVDLADIGNWQLLLQHYDRITSSPEGAPLAPQWMRNLLRPAANLADFFRYDIEPYLRNPVQWMNSMGVPDNIQRIGLLSHMEHTRFLDRRTAPFLNTAFAHHRIGVNTAR